MRHNVLANVVVGALVVAGSVLGFASAASADVQWYGFDTTGDGWWETYLADASGDGVFDTAVIDRNLDGVQDGLAHDFSRNGYFDVFGLDSNQNGYYEIMGADRDDNGDIDFVVIDLNENGVEDSNEQLYPTYAYVGGAPTYSGTGALLLTLADISGRATFGSGDFDADGTADPYDPDPYNPRRW